MKRTQAGKAYGALTAKFVAVLEALLFIFRNARSGLCFPSYEKIADAAKCARSTVAEAIKALEAVGLISWVHRLARVKVPDPILGSRVRVFRTSNGYQFRDPKPALSNGIATESDFRPGTSNQGSSLSLPPAKTAEIDPSTPLGGQ